MLICAAREDTDDDDDDAAEDGLDLELEEDEEFRFDLGLKVLLLGRLDFPDDCELDFPLPPLPLLLLFAACSAMLSSRLDFPDQGATWNASVVQDMTSKSWRNVAIDVPMMV